MQPLMFIFISLSDESDSKPNPFAPSWKTPWHRGRLKTAFKYLRPGFTSFVTG